MTRKEKIIEILNKYQSTIPPLHNEGMIDPMDFHKIADAILSLPLDVPSEEEIEDMADKKHPCYNDHTDSKVILFYAIDCNIGFMEGAKWAINEILKRNGNLSL